MENKLSDEMALFFENDLIAMSITTPQMNWKKVNKKFSSILGYPLEELVHLTWQDITHPDDLEKSLTLFNDMLSGKFEEYSIEKRFFHKNYSTIYVKMHINCIKKEDGSIDYILALVEDITDYMEIKNTLEKINFELDSCNKQKIVEYRDLATTLNLEIIEREEKERIIKNKELESFSLLKHLADNVARWDLEGKYLCVNTSYEQMSGLREFDVIGKRIHDLFPEYDKVIETIDNIRLNKVDNVVHISQEVLVNEKIEIHDIKIIAEKDEDDNIISILGIGRDISEFLNIKKELERSEKKFRTLIQKVRTPIYRFGKDFKRLYVNPEVEKLVGKSYDELVNKTPFDVKLIDDDSIILLKKALDRVFNTKEMNSREFRFIFLDKTIKYFVLDLIPEFDINGDVESILVISFDITSQKELIKN